MAVRFSRHLVIAAVAAAALAAHLIARASGWTAAALGISTADWPLVVALAVGGIPLVAALLRHLWRREFGSDLLAGLSIVTSALVGEYLAGTVVVLMLSGGEVLESYAVHNASSVLDALARRSPTRAHRRRETRVEDVALDDVVPGDVLVVYPHEICPVDGHVVEGHGSMDESYLTGEPYVIAKTPGSAVLSGAVNGEAALTITADRRAVDSRYARIMTVMRESEQRRPRLRRLADQLGALYTPIAIAIALAAWAVTRDPIRFLAVLVIATPCPLLIAIPVAIIGAISLAARRGIIVKDPAALERLDTCRVVILDKTGTLTYGSPTLTEIIPLRGVDPQRVTAQVASLERYSKHPLAKAVIARAEADRLPPYEVARLAERPGDGLAGVVDGQAVQVTSRAQALQVDAAAAGCLPPAGEGMECVVLVDDRVAALFRFRDEPRAEGRSFVTHLGPRHQFERALIVSGDRESEVRYLADQVGIHEVHFSQTPEQKLAIVRAETARAPTLFLGDGINDAPALAAATVGVGFGHHSDVTSEAARVVVMDSSLQRVDELLHIARRLRSVALQSAIGGMALSAGGMLIAAGGWLTPVAGALAQEAIDLWAVMNALRVAVPPKKLSDF